MPSPTLRRVTIAALFVIASFCTLSAQPNPRDTFDQYCHHWGKTLKDTAAKAKSDAQRNSTIKDANAELELNLKLVEFPKADFNSMVSRLRTCLENEAKAAFGQGTSVTVTPSLKLLGKAVPTGTLIVTIQVSPGSSVTTQVPAKPTTQAKKLCDGVRYSTCCIAGVIGNGCVNNGDDCKKLGGTVETSPTTKGCDVVFPNYAGSVAPPPAIGQGPLPKEMGKTWGEKCIPTGATRCCNSERNAATACQGLERERAGSPVVRNCDDAEKICQTMVRCDHTLNDCKKAAMVKDTHCDGTVCKKCTSDYKICHDNAYR